MPIHSPLKKKLCVNIGAVLEFPLRSHQHVIVHVMRHGCTGEDASLHEYMNQAFVFLLILILGACGFDPGVLSHFGQLPPNTHLPLRQLV
jgi:hypothetical protein